MLFIPLELKQEPQRKEFPKGNKDGERNLGIESVEYITIKEKNNKSNNKSCPKKYKKFGTL